jgi:hypothetical protein
MTLPLHSAFRGPYDAWAHVKKGEQELPEPLEDHEKLWRKIAERLGHTGDVRQLAPVIGGRRRYHHRPLSSWLLSNGKVLTLTTDEQEAKVWNNLKRKRHPAMPRIYDVFAVRFAGEKRVKLWAIVHERVTWPVDDDWLRFVDSFFRWRAWSKGALKPAQASDLEGFLRFIIDPEATDPKVVQRHRIEHVLPWQMTKERRKDVKQRRQDVYSGPDLEGKIEWAKAALKFLRANKVRFRDLDPSNLAKTKKGGRVVITNLAESRSLPKRVGRLGSVTAQALTASVEALVHAYRKSPDAVLMMLLTQPSRIVSAEAATTQPPTPLAGAHPAIETLLRIARFMERDAQSLGDEFQHVPPKPETLNTLIRLVDALEKTYKRTAQKLVHLR